MDRDELLNKVKKVVVKVGTAVLSRPDGFLDYDHVARLAEQAHRLRERGLSTIIVSSGAIGAGMAELGIGRRPTNLPALQAVAAVGQGKLIGAYEACFQGRGYHAAQILLTRQDFEDRARYLNASDTLRTLLKLGAVPVINENDTTSVEEIAFSDNDLLSAFVTNLAGAHLLVMLTVVDGLCAVYKRGECGRVIPVVDRITDEVRRMAAPDVSPGGLGGMRSKIEAADLVTSAGETAIVANGREPDVLCRIFDGEPLGTLFLPARRRMSSRKRWIGLTSRPRGALVVDDGAREALVRRGRSLLASGIIEVRGRFARGDPAAVLDRSGAEFARGLVNYSSPETERIKGLRSAAIRKVLGHKPYDEVIHRDNLVVSPVGPNPGPAHIPPPRKLG